MSNLKYCYCGAQNLLASKFCCECSKPFAGTVVASAPPVKQVNAKRRQITEHDTQDDDDDDGEPDTAYVPSNLEALECDIEINTNRQSLHSLAHSPKSTDAFRRPPEKTPKNKKDFEKNFMADFKKEAGSIRPK